MQNVYLVVLRNAQKIWKEIKRKHHQKKRYSCTELFQSDKFTVNDKSRSYEKSHYSIIDWYTPHKSTKNLEMITKSNQQKRWEHRSVPRLLQP